MKKILLVVLLVSPFFFSQQKPSQNLLTLENELKLNLKNYTEVQVNPIQEVKKKKAGLAILYSLLLPGMGELYAESYSSGKYFTIAEGALWLTFIGVSSYGNWQKDNYTSFAASNADVVVSGKDEDYFSIISEFNSVEEFNNDRALNQAFLEMYNGADYRWNWESDSDRRAYRKMWVSSEQAFNNLRFVVGAMLVNRLISVINAVRLVAAYNNRVEEMGWNVSIGLQNDIDYNPALTLSFQSAF